MTTENIGFIGGGQMAEALIKGLTQSGSYPAENIYVLDPSPERKDFLTATYNINTIEDCGAAFATCQKIFLAVKPQVMSLVLQNCQGIINEDHLLITIAAGLPISSYVKTLALPRLKIIRVMPNTPALVGQSASALTASPYVSQEELDKVQNIFNQIGTTTVLEECHLDAVTGLSGSGPAYVFSFIEALIDAGVAEGLNRQVSTNLALQTVAGSVELLRQNGEHPAVERARVSSPGGTTIAASKILERSGFQAIIMDAVAAATEKSKELGKGK
ncbi:pyrroline-5-carboxylate reductase [Desulfotalea psychrophila]|uniref:Pyrroline-5-carboxylate reductase n=1 Tax=Desulfotalea psychrophila (strain LSv54 / DSM 12343) TaxID=177439 RepID=Q6AL13_DESPS|nr:pyrroline-5-carboxylate reductase [Desulfotalea psychrophila]CAG36962.1 related to pyrroline-5-carboxylate reductase [Desulfotalea psychrophila LSv54]